MTYGLVLHGGTPQNTSVSVENMRPFFAAALALAIGMSTAFAGFKKDAGASKREKVRTLLRDAVEFISTGRYDLARKRCDQALRVDPFNVAARQLLEKLQAADINRDRILPKNDSPLLVLLAGNDPSLAGSGVPEIVTVGIRRSWNAEEKQTLGKLARITLPLMAFNETSLMEALNWLTDECQRLDKGGVGLKVTVTPRAAVSEARMTAAIQNIPAIEVLKYICQLANVEYAIAEDGTLIVDRKKVSRE